MPWCCTRYSRNWQRPMSPFSPLHTRYWSSFGGFWRRQFRGPLNFSQASLPSSTHPVGSFAYATSGWLASTLSTFCGSPSICAQNLHRSTIPMGQPDKAGCSTNVLANALPYVNFDFNAVLNVDDVVGCFKVSIQREAGRMKAGAATVDGTVGTCGRNHFDALSCNLLTSF